MRTMDDVLPRLPRRVHGNARFTIEFRPGAASLWRRADVCQLVLESLVEAKFLCVKSDGAYARLTDGDHPRPRTAKADPKPRMVQAS